MDSDGFDASSVPGCQGLFQFHWMDSLAELVEQAVEAYTFNSIEWIPEGFQGGHIRG